METLPLKDIHLPETVSAWPPAPGWIALTILLLSLLVTGFFLYKHIKQRLVLRSAEKMLRTLKADKNLDSLQALKALSVWLRRVAISISPRDQVASLSGAKWLAYLDASCKDAPFSLGIGRCFADAQYRQNLPDNTNIEELFKLCEHWLKQQRPKPRRVATRFPKKTQTTS